MNHYEKKHERMDAISRRELYKKLKKSKPVFKPAHPVEDYTAAVRELLNTINPAELESFGHDVFSGCDQMEAALKTIDQLAEYDRAAAYQAYLDFMDVNFSGMSISFDD